MPLSDGPVRAADEFIRQLAIRFNRDPDTWWVVKLILLTHFEGFSWLSGTECGFLVSIDMLEPGNIGITAEPAPPNLSRTTPEALMHCNGSGTDAAAAWEKLVAMPGDWRFAVGAGVREADEDIRLYAGTPDLSRSARLISVLSDAGLWFPTLADDAFEIVQRIRPFAACMGFTRRFSSSPSFAVYFASDVALSDDLIAYVAEPFGWEGVRTLQKFAAEISPGRVIGSRRHGWSVSINSAASLAFLKLEVSDCADMDPAILNKLFHGGEGWIRDAARQCGLNMSLQTCSCRLRGEDSGLTAYFNFTSNRSQVRLLIGGTTFSLCMPASGSRAPLQAGEEPSRSSGAQSVESAVKPSRRIG
jgi:hypothetical protein